MDWVKKIERLDVVDKTIRKYRLALQQKIDTQENIPELNQASYQLEQIMASIVEEETKMLRDQWVDSCIIGM